jgi:hypothetical protein
VAIAQHPKFGFAGRAFDFALGTPINSEIMRFIRDGVWLITVANRRSVR